MKAYLKKQMRVNMLSKKTEDTDQQEKILKSIKNAGQEENPWEVSPRKIMPEKVLSCVL
jgi:hypothetical protein